MVHKVQSGHPGGSLGCTDLLVSLFFNIMKRKEDFDMNGKNEDIFFLSNGHISPVFYSVLSRAGYFDLNELNTFRELNSRLQGHPATHEGLPGIRIASGSLGQGLSVSIGSAISKKLNNDVINAIKKLDPKNTFKLTRAFSHFMNFMTMMKHRRLLKWRSAFSKRRSLTLYRSLVHNL